MALIKPPKEGPVTTATFSVAVLKTIERGIIANADKIKIEVSFHFRKSDAIDRGMKMDKPKMTTYLNLNCGI
jgi:hypothetical protein